MLVLCKVRASLLAAATVLAGAAALAAATPAAAASSCGSIASTLGAISCDWAATVAAPIVQSSPAAVTIAGRPAVVVGDGAGYLDAFAVAGGAQLWRIPTGAARIDAPVSASPDGSTVYAGLTSSTKGSPELAAYRATTGARIATAHACPATGGCRQLGGVSTTGTTQAVGGPQQYAYGLTPTLAARWAYLNSDSINSTPATADLTGSGHRMSVFTTDQTPNSAVGALSGGHLRIFTDTGAQVCNANIGGGPAHPGSFDSSSAIGAVAGVPIIVFGTGQSGADPNRLLAFDAACQRLWYSPALAGPTIGAPSMADVAGRGSPQVIEVVNDANRNPTVAVIDAVHATVLGSTTVRRPGGAACGPAAQGTSQSAVTVAVDGKQYLVVPAGSCGAMLMSFQGGRFSTIAQLAPYCGVQNSPVVTVDGANRVGITVAGYKPDPVTHRTVGCVYHYSLATRTAATLGQWSEFHHDAQLSGALSLAGAQHDTMVSVQTLSPGQWLRSVNGYYRLVMQTDGNLVVVPYSGTPHSVLPSGTRLVRGSRMQVTNTGMRVLTATNGLVWQYVAPRGTPPTLHLVMSNSGRATLAVASTNRWRPDVTLWSR